MLTALIADLSAPEWKVRSEAARVLGTKRHRPAVELLIERLKKDKSMTVCSRAAVALGRIQDPRAIEPLLEAGGQCVKHATNQLPKFGEAAVPLLAARLADKSRPFVSRCIMTNLLGDIGGDRARSALIAAAWDEEAAVRCHVAAALGKCGVSEESFEALLFLLRDPVPMVSGDAARSLGALRDEHAIEILVNILHGDRPFEQEFDLFNSITNVLRSWANVRG